MRTRGNSDIISPSAGIAYDRPPGSPNQLSGDEEKEYVLTWVYTCVFNVFGVLYKKEVIEPLFTTVRNDRSPR